MKSIHEIEGIVIRPAEKITKKRILRFENEQRSIAKTYNLDEPKAGQTKEERKLEGEKLDSILRRDVRVNLEYMALTASCFLNYEREGEHLDFSDIDTFLDEQVDVDDLEVIATMAAERLQAYYEERKKKMRSQGGPKSRSRKTTQN